MLILARLFQKPLNKLTVAVSARASAACRRRRHTMSQQMATVLVVRGRTAAACWNTVKNIDRRQAWAYSSIAPQSAPFRDGIRIPT